VMVGGQVGDPSELAVERFHHNWAPLYVWKIENQASRFDIRDLSR